MYIAFSVIAAIAVIAVVVLGIRSLKHKDKQPVIDWDDADTVRFKQVQHLLEPGDVELRDSIINAIKIAGQTPDLLCPNGRQTWDGKC